MNDAVKLVARREITSRLQQRGFRIGFGIALLIVVIACVLPSFFSDDSGPTKYDVGVADSQRGLAEQFQAYARSAADGADDQPQLTVHVVPAAEAQRKVRDGDWDVAVLPGPRLLAEKKDSTATAIVQQLYRQLAVVGELKQARLTDAQITQALDVEPLAVTTADSDDDSQRQVIAVAAVLVLFTQLATFCTWVAMGVVEEKASRVVELILSSIRPLQLLTGKLLGIGVLAAGQVLLIGVAALVAGTAADTISVPASALATVATAFVGFVLGFAFFASLAAALGSTVSRQEEVSGVLAPVTLSLTVCYGAAFATTSNPDGTFTRVLSIVPPISALAMPSRIAQGGVPVLDVVAAVVLLLLAAAGITAVAARIYRATVLHSGTRVSLKRAWRGEAVADID